MWKVKSLVEIVSVFILILSLQTGLVTGAIALWKSLLIHHRAWTGYLVDANGRYMSSFRVLSVQGDDDGVAYVEFTSRHVSMEMTVLSDDNRIVEFRETLTWNKTAHYQGHTSLVFKGIFGWEQLYYKFNGNVSSAEEENFASVMFMPEGKAFRPRQKEDKTDRVGLYVGIPIVLAVIVVCVGIMIMVWAVRKGYLRHVPFNYKSFRNTEAPKRGGNDIDLDRNRPAATPPEEPAMHI